MCFSSYKSLQPDYAQYLARAYFASLASQNNSKIFTPTALKHPDDFVATSKARWTNGLWFVSLIFSLLVALLAILAKQWLEEYSSRMRSRVASPRHWAWRHLVFNRGLKHYHLETFISALPVMLHGSLFLFLFGLVLFLWSLDTIVASLILGITGGALLLYFGATLAPFWIGTFPTATPLLRQGYTLFHAIVGIIWGFRHADTVYKFPTAPFECVLSSLDAASMDAQVICTMVSALPAEEDVCVALQAIGSLDPRVHPVPLDRESTNGADEELQRLASPLHTSWIESTVQNYFERFVESTFEPSDIARWLRTVAFVDARCTIASWRTDQWMNTQAHDVGLLSALQLQHEDPIVTVTDLPGSDHDSLVGPDPPLFLASNVLVLVSRRIETMSLHTCTALFALIAPHITEVSTEEQGRYMAVIDLLLQRVEDIAESDGVVAVSRLPITYSHLRNPQVFGAIRALNVFGLLHSLDPSVAEDLGGTQPFEPAICAALLMMKWGEYKVDWQDCCRALAFFTTSAFTDYSWPNSSLKTVAEIYANGYFRPKEASNLPPDLPARILHATLVQCNEKYMHDTDSEMGRSSTIQSVIKILLRGWGRFQLSTCKDHAVMLAQAESVEAAVHRRLLGWLHHLEDNIYAPEAAEQNISIWKLIRDVVPLGFPLVREIVTQLCVLHRSDVPTKHMFMEILPDRDDGLDIIGLTADCKFGQDGVFESFTADVTIAQHAKEVSPKWWTAAAGEMRSMLAPCAQSSDAEFATLAEFADHVEAQGPCPHCPQGVVFTVPRVESPASVVHETAVRIDQGVEQRGLGMMQWARGVKRHLYSEQHSIV